MHAPELHAIEHTLRRTQTMIELLRARVAAHDELADRGELSLLSSTTRRIEALMQQAAELAEALEQRLARTNERLGV
ncbi:hypothetical protein ACG02S_16460 [Roseateles sp. DC23W]|uniref:Uncharacterized protein n=1 Tax=Pelomonas dachongensis TaxID=3299029 RepID=A0ABW7ETA9_9BURK